MLASRVATPVLEHVRPGAAGVVRGAGGSAAYVDFDGFVVAITAPDVALMPNGIALAERPRPHQWPRPGAPARLLPGRLDTGAGSVAWPADRPPVWDPTLRIDPASGREVMRARGEAILAALGVAPVPAPEPLADAFAATGAESAAGGAARDAIALLLRSVAARDPDLAARAGGLLVGRGAGLTPDGDDVLASTAAVVAAMAQAAGWTGRERDAWLHAVLPARLRALTTPLSATLLELATAGRVVEPVHDLLDLGERARWRVALDRLERIGHSTGPSYATGAGAAALLCTA